MANQSQCPRITKIAMPFLAVVLAFLLSGVQNQFSFAGPAPSPELVSRPFPAATDTQLSATATLDGHNLHISGQLTASDGAKMAGKAISVQIEGWQNGSVATDAEGNFQQVWELEDLSPTTPITFVYSGDGQYVGAQITVQPNRPAADPNVSVVSAKISETSIHTGEPHQVSVSGVVTLTNGQPVTEGSVKVTTTISDNIWVERPINSDGTFECNFGIPADTPPQKANIAVKFIGLGSMQSSNSTLAVELLEPTATPTETPTETPSQTPTSVSPTTEMVVNPNTPDQPSSNSFLMWAAPALILVVGGAVLVGFVQILRANSHPPRRSDKSEDSALDAFLS